MSNETKTTTAAMGEYETAPVGMIIKAEGIPSVSIIDYIVEKLNEKIAEISSLPWIVEIDTGRQILFGDVGKNSIKLAKSFKKLGLEKGDILFYATYNMTDVYIAILSAWRIGVAARGCYQKEIAENYERQIREGKIKVILVDSETINNVRKACQNIEWDIKLINIGDSPLNDIISFKELLEENEDDDELEKTEIDSKNDVALIINTSGSTGIPKGAMHTHFSLVSTMYSYLKIPFGVRNSIFLPASNYLASYHLTAMSNLCLGNTFYTVSKFNRDDMFQYLLKSKASTVIMYPYIISWFVRSPELKKHDLSFIKTIGMGGSIFDAVTNELLEKEFPNVVRAQGYAMSEVHGIAATSFGIKSLEDALRMKTCEFQGTAYTSCGKISPLAQVKIVNENNGERLGRMKCGEILVRAPNIMIGYLTEKDKPPNSSDIDKDGWLHTGDLGFFDDEGFLYVLERKSFVFKYYMHFVTPTEIETVLSKHPAIREVGVVGVPNVTTTNLARAFVVLKPGMKATEKEIEDFVSTQLPEHLHLHGGVCFLDKLPENRGQKLDRQKLKGMALFNKKKTHKKCTLL